MRPERYRKLQQVLARRQPDLTVLMEQVNKAHNFSAILRNCDAVGVLEAHAVPPDKGLPVHHHTSAGTKKWVRVHEHATVAEAVHALHAQGFRVLAAHPAEGAVDYRELDLTGPTAFTVGAELFGISDTGRDLADELVSIPMAGMVQSLNVSVAAALLLFEAFRQRDARGMYDRVRVSQEDRAQILFEWAYPRLAKRLQDKGVPYPELDEGGSIMGMEAGTLRRTARRNCAG
jgi:tRNA (guanosine-2'-O-)-methyltransferase